VEQNDWDLGDIQAISIVDGQVTAAADARGKGEARVVEMPTSDVN